MGLSSTAKKRRNKARWQDFGMGALDTTMHLTGAGQVVSGITGKDASSLLGYNYQTDAGQKFDKFSNTASQVMGKVAPISASVGGAALGIPPPVTGAAMSTAQGASAQVLGDPNQDPSFLNSGMTTFKMGGKMKQSYAGGGELTEFNGGGTHEMNPMGGIPQGPEALVEEGETKFNSEDYIFSDRIKVDESTATEFKLPKLKGSTYAELSKKIKDKYNKVERDNDTLGKESLERDLEKLSFKQEEFKQEMFQKHMQKAMEFAPQNVTSPEQNPMTEFAMGGKIKYDGISNPSGYLPPELPPETSGYLPLENGAGFSPLGIYSPDQLAGMEAAGNMPSQFMGGAASQEDYEIIDRYISGEIDINGKSTEPRDISRMLEYAPAAANVAQMAYAAKNKPKVHAENRYNIDNPFEASTIDLSPIKEDIELASNTSFQNAKSTSGGSRALAQTANLEINRNKNKALSDVNVQKQQFDASEKARVQQGTAEVNRINSMLERGMLDKNEANRAMYEAYMFYGMGQLGKNIGNVAGENTDAEMVEKTIGFNPYTGEKLNTTASNKNGGYLRKKTRNKTK